MAIKINEPLGPSGNGPLILRLVLGAYFTMAGLSKLKMMSAFIAQVKTFGVLPPNAVELYAVLLPYIEIFIGGCFIIGLWTTLAGILASLLLGSFVVAFGVFPGGMGIFNKDIVLLAAVVGLMYTGPGFYSFDNIRRAPAAGS